MGIDNLREQILHAARGVCSTNSYLNCRLFVQLTSGVSKLESLPKVSGRPQVGDIIQWGSNPARHWSIYLGNGDVLEVPEWGGELGITPIRDVEDEYDRPTAFRRPEWGARTAGMVRRLASRWIKAHAV